MEAITNGNQEKGVERDHSEVNWLQALAPTEDFGSVYEKVVHQEREALQPKLEAIRVDPVRSGALEGYNKW